MTLEYRIFKIILSPHLSEKSSISMEKKNTIVLKVIKNSSKFEIKQAIEKLFSIKVSKINVLVTKGKIKKLSSGRKSHRYNWKKAYITLHKGQKLDVLGMKNNMIANKG